ncbi:MAG: hypothetical protein ACYDG2_04000 [Ruminiclostridium sp.]
MRRELIAWELRKLWSLPMLPIFLLLCLAFNVLLITGSWYSDDYVRYVSEVTERVGGQMGADFDAALAELPQSEYRDALISQTVGATDIYEDYDTAQISDLYVDTYHLTGAAAAIERKCEELQESVGTLAAQDASLSLSAAKMTKPLMESLFYTACRAVIFEGMLLAVLMALYSCGCEKLSRTEHTVYSTRTGRNVQYAKAASSALSALLSYLILAVATVAVFELLWKPGAIWNASMSSQFNYYTAVIYKLPFITWAPFTVRGYLAATLVLGAAVVLIFHGLGFIAGLLTGDAYKGFLAFLAFAVFNLAAQMFSVNAGLWELYQLAQWLPLNLWWFQPIWFTEMGVGAVLPWQECWTAVFCGLATLALLYVTSRHFRKKDVL